MITELELTVNKFEYYEYGLDHVGAPGVVKATNPVAFPIVDRPRDVT